MHIKQFIMNGLSTLPLLLFLLTACQTNSAQNAKTASTIAATEYQTLLKKNKDVQLIDVRTPEEFRSGHLQGASNIDYNGEDFMGKMNKLDKNKPTMIYCLSGGRSGSALNDLKAAGFKEVYNLKGGIMQWKAAGLPLDQAPAAAGWTGMSREAYQQLISGSVPVLVDFNAKWCGPCKQLKPILEAIQQEYAGKIKIVAVDIDENKSLAQSMSINNIPLLIYHENGKVVMNQEGYIDKQGLIDLLKLKK